MPGRSCTGCSAPRATEAAAVALGTEVHFGDDNVTGGALVWDLAVVHLAAFGTSGTADGQ